MTQGEKLGTFGDEHWGSRNGRNANTCVLLKHFTYEMMQLTETDGGTLDNDAKACFDRIIPALTNLRSRQLGVRASACHTHAELLLKATYAVKTQAGISDKTYCHSDEDPLYGEDQGTKWAAAAWVIISALIIGLDSEGTRGSLPQRNLISRSPSDKAPTTKT